MVNKNIGVISKGITCPIIREGDDIVDIVVNSVINASKVGLKMRPRTPFSKGLGLVPNEYEYNLSHKDVIGITESVVARAAGLYVTVDEIAEDIKKKFGENADITLVNPIYSRNRFSMILKGIARAARTITFVMPDYDEVGNPSGVNPFTGVNIKQYYADICKNENCPTVFVKTFMRNSYNKNVLYCGLHKYEDWILNNTDLDIEKRYCTLANICSDKNPDFGLLGSNKATEERLKLFPTVALASKVCEEIKKKIIEKTGKDVIVMVYGDGSYKDLDAGIWEMADPVSSPGYTDKELLDSTPNEIKVKAYADDKFKNLSGDELEEAIKNEISLNKGKNLKGTMTSQGTTPRRYVNLLASLMDLTSGSGDRCTPIVVIRNYFKRDY